MQDWNNCNSLSVNDIVYLTDIRDNNMYPIAKLPDNKCWMIQNLRLVDRSIDSSNSNINNSFIVKSSNLVAFTSIDNSNDAVYYNDNIEDGAYYTWYTATAGTGTINLASGDASGSICPKGWRLPKGGASGEFAGLDKAYGGSGISRTDITTRDKLIASPVPHFVYAGYINHVDSTLGNYDFGCYLWSSTIYNTEGAYNLSFSGSGYLNPISGTTRRYGRSIRCIKS